MYNIQFIKQAFVWIRGPISTECNIIGNAKRYGVAFGDIGPRSVDLRKDVHWPLLSR